MKDLICRTCGTKLNWDELEGKDDACPVCGDVWVVARKQTARR